MPRLLAAPSIALCRRILAVGCVALVLLLTIGGGSPTAHAWMHAADQDEGAHHEHPTGPSPCADSCAILLFASGVDLPAGDSALRPPAWTAHTAAARRVADLYLVSPRFLRQPERGPPQG